MVGKRGLMKKLMYVLYLGIFTIVGAEVTLRIFVDSDPAFYVAFSDPEPGVPVHYPYGEIIYNTDGFADEEFDDVKSMPRVGYIGDSVCFGVGAGYGYRISELMQQYYPGYEHLNLTRGLGGGAMEVSERAVTYGEEYDLDAVVYLMNLNDIRPEGKAETLNKIQHRKFVRALEWLRGRSYLYTYMRQVVKELRNKGGGAPPAYEMFPDEYGDIVLGTADRVAAIDDELSQMGIRFVVLILPYEMQVSEEAAEVYSAAGTSWDPDFIEGKTQSMVRDRLGDTWCVDGLEAFLGKDHDLSRRNDLGVGEAFVYDLGERLDWNHPNRLGQRLLAEELAGSGALDNLGE